MMNDWARCKGWIEAALEHAEGTHTIEDIEDGIVTGRFQFWPNNHSAIVTEVILFPQIKVLNFFLIGGDLDELKEMEPLIVAWAREVRGCSRAIGIGRKGFERAFAASGYKPRWYLIAKELHS